MEKVTSELSSHFLNLYNIALSDTNLDTEELNFLYEFGASRGINKDSIDYVIRNPHKVKFEMPKGVYEKIECLYDFAKMILADGIIDPREINIFEAFILRFGFAQENAQEIINFLIEEAKQDTPIDVIFKNVQKSFKDE